MSHYKPLTLNTISYPRNIRFRLKSIWLRQVFGLGRFRIHLNTISLKLICRDFSLCTFVVYLGFGLDKFHLFGLLFLYSCTLICVFCLLLRLEYYLSRCIIFICFFICITISFLQELFAFDRELVTPGLPLFNCVMTLSVVRPLCVVPSEEQLPEITNWKIQCTLVFVLYGFYH